MEVSISAVVAQVINFGIMYWLFSKFAAKPLADAIESRKELLRKLKNADEAYEEKLEIAKAESKQIIQEGIRRKEKLISEAGILADNKKTQILNDTRVQADKILFTAEQKSKALQSELEKGFSDGVKRTSLLVVKKLIQKDPNIQEDYLNEMVNEAIK